LPQPWIIAHRGSCRRAPENTLKAFELALREGADGVECDVWKCASGEMVVTHNNELEKLTHRPGMVEDWTLNQLRELDFGQGERISTLEEVLDLVAPMEILNIELKGKKLRSRGIEASVLQILEKRRLLGKTIVSSFNPTILYRLKRRSRRVQLGLIFHQGSSLPLRRAWAAPWLRLTSLHPENKLLTPALVNRAQRKNQKVIAWTINNIHDLEKCTHYGVHGIITDDPRWARNNLKKG